MVEWLSEYYLRLIVNYQILMGNPTECGAVELLRLFTFTLFGVLGLKLLFHIVAFQLLQRRFVPYGEDEHPRLWTVYRQAIAHVGLRRTPRLFRFVNARPTIFTIGSLRPTIFMAPKLVHELPDQELEAALVHELTHVKRQDNLLLWLLEIVFAAIPVLAIQVFALSFVFNMQNSILAILGVLVVLAFCKAFLYKRILFLRELSCDDLAVQAIGNPLVLASSLVNAWRHGQAMPAYRWSRGLAFAQTLLPLSIDPEYRVRRLLDYHRPRFKFLLGKIARVASLGLVVFTAFFLWQFHSSDRYLFVSWGCDKGLHVCSVQCAPK